MSKKIKERTKQLAAREAAIKDRLLGKKGSVKSQVNKLGRNALIGGVVAIIIYGIYRSFVASDSKPKKKKQVVPANTASGVVAEKLMTFILPYLGKALDSFLNRKGSNPEKEEESAKED